MAEPEPQKEKPSSADDVKKKSLILDKQIGDKMDISFHPGPKSKKKVFDSDKLDMDFILEVSGQQSHSEKAMSTQPFDRQTTHDFPGELVGGVDSNGDDVANGRNDGCPQTTIVTTISSGKGDINDKMLIGFENDESAKGDLDIGETSATLVSRKTPQDIKSIKGNQNATLKLPLSTQASESTVEKFALTNESGAREFYSKISKRLEDTRPQLNQPPLIGATFLSSGNNRKIGTTHLCPAIEKGEGSDSDGVPNRTKLLGNSQLCDKEGIDREPVVGSEQRKILKKFRNIGGNKVSLNAAPPKEVKSWSSSEQNKELQGNVEMNTAEIVDGREKMLQNLRLKQKKIEGLNPGLASLKPLKHLSLSPIEAGSSSTRAGSQGLIELDTYDQGKRLGTTIIAMVGRNRIFIASDGRLCSGERDDRGLILTGVCQKIHAISPHIFATSSGFSRECDDLIFAVKGVVDSSTEVASMAMVKEACDNYINLWKVDHPKAEGFPGTVMVFGYHDGRPSIYSATRGEHEESHRGAIVGSGSGFPKAKEYIEKQLENQRRQMREPNSRRRRGEPSSRMRRRRGEPRSKEYQKWLKVAIAVAALDDAHSAGFIGEAYVRKGKKGKIYEEMDHVLVVLENNFDELTSYMARLLILMSKGMPYTFIKEFEFRKTIAEACTFEGVDAAHTIAVVKEPDIITIRVILFEDAAACSGSLIHPGNGIQTFPSEDGTEMKLFLPTRDRIAELCQLLTGEDDLVRDVF